MLNPAQFSSVLGALNPSQLTTALGALAPAQITNLLSGLNPAQFSSIVGALNPAQISAALSGFTPAQLTAALGALSPAQLTSVLGAVTPAQITNLLGKLNPTQLTAALGAMDPAQLTNLLGAMTPAQLNGLLGTLSPAQLSTVINKLPPGVVAALPLAPLVPGSAIGSARTVPINGAINGITLANVDLNVSIGPDRLQTSLQNLVKASLNGYITANFSHRFLGGAATTLDYAPRAGDDYNCSYMDRVYHLAKCTDIVTDDRFWSFSELIDPDPRLLPPGGACTATQITQEKIDLAENKDFTYVNFDRVATYNDLLLPPALGNTCAAPVPTGVIVTNKTRTIDRQGNVNITNTETFQDMVCPNPNCRYNRGAGAGTCVQ